MKRLATLSLAIALALAPSPIVLAQAGPDHEAILNALTGMKQDINRMIALVERHRAGAVSIGPESVTLTAAQQTLLLNRYNTLKAALAAKYAQLP